MEGEPYCTAVLEKLPTREEMGGMSEFCFMYCCSRIYVHKRTMFSL